jgi:hypothetical protein
VPSCSQRSTYSTRSYMRALSRLEASFPPHPLWAHGAGFNLTPDHLTLRTTPHAPRPTPSALHFALGHLLAHGVVWFAALTPIRLDATGSPGQRR